MALPLTGTALAFDDSESGQDITIRITPPSGWSVQIAEVEICLTDNAGKGFQSAQVQAGGGAWKDITGELAQAGNRWSAVVEITENCAVSVKVTGKDGMTYEKSQLIQCFRTTAPEPCGGDTDAAPSAAPQPTSGPATPPSGQGTVIDNVSGTSEESGREFFTIATPDENVFYLVIDRKKDSENVYFLNAVTEADLMALAEKDKEPEGGGVSAVPEPEPVCSCKEKCVPGAVRAGCPVCILSYQDCAGTAEAPGQTDPEPEKPKSGGGIGTIVIVLLAALAVGAAGWYIKIYRPRKELAEAEDLDELTGAGEEEPTVNEDDLPAAMAYPVPNAYPEPDSYPEPDEPDYPDSYEDGT